MNRELEKLEAELINCRMCPRLVAWREEIAQKKRRMYLDWDYWGKPVPGFGDPLARLLIIGLAPGAHGSNRTGRMFTGDGSGDFFYPALYRAGFASQPEAKHKEDGLTLSDCWVTSVGHCAPPANKPTPQELENCQAWLVRELALLPNIQGVVVLGKIALDGLLKVGKFSSLPKKDFVFGHDSFYEGRDGLPWVLCSYHPSLQNTQTGRLTESMFDQIWQEAKERLV